MGLIDELKSRIQQYQNTIEDDRQRIDEYNQKITEIEQIYKDMKIEKEQLISEKSDVQAVANESYSNWTGNLYDNEYEPILEDDLLNGSLKATIRAIDENLDA